MLRRQTAVKTSGNLRDECRAAHWRGILSCALQGCHELSTAGSILASNHRCCHHLNLSHPHHFRHLVLWPFLAICFLRMTLFEHIILWLTSFLLPSRLWIPLPCCLYLCLFDLIHICSCYFLFFWINILGSIQNTESYYDISHQPFLLSSLLPPCPAAFELHHLNVFWPLIYLHCFFYSCWITVEDINDSSSVPCILGLDHQDLPLIFLFETVPRVTKYGWKSHWHLQLMSLYVCNSQTLLGLDFEETRAGDSCHLPVTSIPLSVTEVSLGTHLCITCLWWGFITNTLFYITIALSNTWLMDCDT